MVGGEKWDVEKIRAGLNQMVYRSFVQITFGQPPEGNNDRRLILYLFEYVLGGVNFTFSGIQLMIKKDLYCHAYQWPSKKLRNILIRQT